MLKNNYHSLFVSLVIIVIPFFFTNHLAALTLVMSTDKPQEINSETKEEKLPEAVSQAVMEDIVKNNPISLEELQITKAEKELWSNGCLGLAQEGEFCTQAIVPGWRVFVTREEKTWIYRTNETGMIFRQEK